MLLYNIYHHNIIVMVFHTGNVWKLWLLYRFPEQIAEQKLIHQNQPNSNERGTNRFMVCSPSQDTLIPGHDPVMWLLWLFTVSCGLGLE